MYENLGACAFVVVTVRMVRIGRSKCIRHVAQNRFPTPPLDLLLSALRSCQPLRNRGSGQERQTPQILSLLAWRTPMKVRLRYQSAPQQLLLPQILVRLCTRNRI